MLTDAILHQSLRLAIWQKRAPPPQQPLTHEQIAAVVQPITDRTICVQATIALVRKPISVTELSRLVAGAVCFRGQHRHRRLELVEDAVLALQIAGRVATTGMNGHRIVRQATTARLRPRPRERFRGNWLAPWQR